MNKRNDLASPHLRMRSSTVGIMLCVLLALLPAVITGCLNYGRHAVLLLAVTTGSALLFEFFMLIILRRDNTVPDLSAAVTGLLLGMSLPPELPLWQAVVGSFAAIVIVKQLFGGIGRNFANPAGTAWIIMMLAFHANMTTWRLPMSDTVLPASAYSAESASILDLLLGNTAGNIGQSASVGLLLGGIFLCLCGLISPVTPLSFLGSFALLTWLGGYDIASEMLCGSLLLCACFMANDYTTTPLTRAGKLIFGLCCGILTFVIRHYGGYQDSAVFAVVIMNLFTPLLDKMTAAKPFGYLKHEKKPKTEESEEEPAAA